MTFPLPVLITLKVFRYLSNDDLEFLRTAFPELHNLQEDRRVQATRVIVPFVRKYLDLGAEHRELVGAIMQLFWIIDNPKQIGVVKITLGNELYDYKWMEEGWFKRKSLRGGFYIVRIKHSSEKIKRDVLSRKEEINYILFEKKLSDVLYESKLIYDRNLKYYHPN